MNEVMVQLKKRRHTFLHSTIDHAVMDFLAATEVGKFPPK
jgi:hypothetical protein